jgi:hypothetical protein
VVSDLGAIGNHLHLINLIMDEAKLKLRREVLKILMSKYGHENNNKAIYECADEWCEKYVISAGVVDYYNAYKQSFINKSLNDNT